MFSAASPGHLLVVLAVALLVLGPTELPRLLRAISEMRRQLRALQTHLSQEIHDVVDPNITPRPVEPDIKPS
jgi:Sec-independent protein translocase protein TatA